MIAIPTLFGEWAVMREWSRIGSPGTVRTDIYADEESAITALSEIARQKQRRGYCVAGIAGNVMRLSPLVISPARCRACAAS